MTSRWTNWTRGVITWKGFRILWQDPARSHLFWAGKIVSHHRTVEDAKAGAEFVKRNMDAVQVIA